MRENGTYNDDFRKKAVDRVINKGLPAITVAREYGVSYPTLLGWVKRFRHEVLSREEKAIIARSVAQESVFRDKLAEALEQIDVDSKVEDSVPQKLPKLARKKYTYYAPSVKLALVREATSPPFPPLSTLGDKYGVPNNNISRWLDEYHGKSANWVKRLDRMSGVAKSFGHDGFKLPAGIASVEADSSHKIDVTLAKTFAPEVPKTVEQPVVAAEMLTLARFAERGALLGEAENKLKDTLFAENNLLKREVEMLKFCLEEYRNLLSRRV